MSLVGVEGDLATGNVVVSMRMELLDAILEGAKRLFPRETILLLRGKKTKDTIVVTDLLVPPLANYGHGFAHIPIYMMPMDFSIVGTVHSHPSGNFNPSPTDLNHMFGRVLMIVAAPYKGEANVAAYNRNGDRIQFCVTET